MLYGGAEQHCELHCPVLPIHPPPPFTMAFLLILSAYLFSLAAAQLSDPTASPYIWTTGGNATLQIVSYAQQNLTAVLSPVPSQAVPAVGRRMLSGSLDCQCTGCVSSKTMSALSQIQLSFDANEVQYSLDSAVSSLWHALGLLRALALVESLCARRRVTA